MKKAGRGMAELCGAVIGAGFASGRELAAFFARFGPWSWAGVAVSVGLMGILCLEMMRRPGAAGMPEAWQGRFMGRVWQGLFGSLLAVTGGAMLAGGGEVAALMLPLHGAREIGLIIMLAAGWRLARGESAWLAAVSRGLILCLIAMIAAGLWLPPQPGVVLQNGSWEAVLQGLCYGGFNMALAAPVAAMTGSRMNRQEQTRCAAGFVAVITLLLACGNGVLLRHPALLGENLPFVQLLAGLGPMGYGLCGTALYLAALTTLTACLRGLRAICPAHMGLLAAGIVLLSMVGLEGIVGRVYPVLGGGCVLLLMAAQAVKRTKT